jgi:hypothetical protein
MIKKFAANDIANEMFRLLKKTAQVEEDSAQTPTVEAKSEDEANDTIVDFAADDMESEETREADDAEDNLEDFLMKEDEVEDETASYVDDQIESMKHCASDELMRETEGSAEMTASAKDQHLMTGLGKIEASLRRKGEGFAADLVRTTAMSIKQDIVKAANQKTYVLKNLIKMASDLDSRGQRKAAGLVKMTIEKINR